MLVYTKLPTKINKWEEENELSSVNDTKYPFGWDDRKWRRKKWRKKLIYIYIYLNIYYIFNN